MRRRPSLAGGAPLPANRLSVIYAPWSAKEFASEREQDMEPFPEQGRANDSRSSRPIVTTGMTRRTVTVVVASVVTGMNLTVMRGDSVWARQQATPSARPAAPAAIGGGESRVAFYSPLASRRLSSVATDPLAEEASEDDVAATIEDLGDKGSGADGYLHFTAIQLHRQPRYHDGMDPRRPPYPICRFRVDAQPIRLA